MKNNRITRTLIAGFVFCALFAVGCYTGDSNPNAANSEIIIVPQAEKTVPGTELKSIIKEKIKTGVGPHIDAASIDDPLFQEWRARLDADQGQWRNVQKFVIRQYPSRDAKNTPIVLSGLLLVPERTEKDPDILSLPLMVWPHGTELKRDGVGSKNITEEAILAAGAAAFAGFVVVMPDLPGMGYADPNSYHPYCHDKSLAYSIVDIIKATKTVFATNETLKKNYRLNGKQCIIGYSEGGYAAMAAVREIEQNPDPEIGSLTASACMAGPFDLSGAMRKVMVHKTDELPAPFFLPYVIMGYNAVYGNIFNPKTILNKTLVDKGIEKEMDGSKGGSEADEWICAALGIVKGHTPTGRQMMEETWIQNNLDDAAFDASEAGKILKANDLWPNWAPTNKMLLLHSPADDCVPYGNSVKAYDEFKKFDPSVRDRVSFFQIPITGWPKLKHGEAAIVGIPSAIIWLEHQCSK